MQHYWRKYGEATTVDFVLFGTTGVDFKTDAVHAAGDTTIMKDEGAEAATTNGFADEGTGYSIALTASEMTAARIVVYVVDQGTKAWLDTALLIETYGNASAQHAADLDTALPAQVLDAVAANYNNAGSIGEKINDAGGAADPLTNAVPGSYANGTAGAALGALFNTGMIHVRSNVEPETGNIQSIVIGDGYNASKGTEFAWTSADWSALGINDAECTLTFYARNKDGGDVLLEMEAEATSATRIILEPTAAQTKQLVSLAGNNRQGAFQIKAVWSDDADASPTTLVDALILRVIPNRSN